MVHLEKADALLGGWNPSRRVYVQACELLKRVMAMDLPGLIESKVQEWRKNYANRPSLLEEVAIALGELPAKQRTKGSSVGYPR